MFVAGQNLLIKVMQLDLADLDSVASFASEVLKDLEGRKLDLLVLG